MDNNERKIIEFLTNCSLSNLPASTVHEAKRALLDTLGCMVAGLDTPLGQKLAKLTDRFADNKGATVIGVSRFVSNFFAAM